MSVTTPEELASTDAHSQEALLLVGVHDVHPEALVQVAELQAAGYDVSLDETPDYFTYQDPEVQVSVDNEIAGLEAEARTRIAPILASEEYQAAKPKDKRKMIVAATSDLLPLGRDAFVNWAPLTAEATALNNIYDAGADTLGHGIKAAVYERKLFTLPNPDAPGEVVPASALEVIEFSTKNIQTALKKVWEYERFIATTIDPDSRRIWQGSRDGAGVRTRATAAMTEVARYFEQEYTTDHPLQITSLACGAASPIYELLRKLTDGNVPVGSINLVDQNPMALASAYSLAEGAGVQDYLQLHLKNLVRFKHSPEGKGYVGAGDLTAFIEPGSVDVLDMLGLFEYLDEDTAIDLLKEVKKIMRPGGMIIFGNMIDKRPQQDFFSYVSLWQPLKQRSLGKLFELADAAGFDAKRQAKVIVPPQGVYAVMAIRMDAEDSHETAQDADKLALLGQSTVHLA